MAYTLNALALSAGELAIIHRYADLLECTMATYEFLAHKSKQPKGEMRRHQSIITHAIMNLHPQLHQALLLNKDGITRRIPMRLLQTLSYIETLGLDKGVKEYFDRVERECLKRK